MKPDIAVKPDRAAKPRRTLKPRRSAKADRMVTPDRMVKPDRNLPPDRTAGAERAAQAERDRAARVQRERAAQAERERAEAERRRAAQADAGRSATAERERAEAAAQAERDQAERDRAAQAERERAAQANAEPVAQADAHRAAQAEGDQAAQDPPVEASVSPFLALKGEHAAQAAAAAGAQAAASPAPADGTQKAEPDAREPDNPARPGGVKWLPEDYFRPLSAVRNPAEKKAEWAKKAQEDGGKKGEWDERIPWDEQPPWEEQAQPAREAKPDVLNASRGHSRRTSTLAAVVVAVVIAGSVGIALALRSAPTGTPGGKPASPAEIRAQAAAWVDQQVSHNTVVSCDHAMCAALARLRFPAVDLHVLDATSSNPASTVIIATPTIRSQFGSSLGSSLAPLVLAKFGTGSAQVDVRLVAPHGAAAYRQALRNDVLARKAAGIELLGNPLIHASALARKQLAAGEVDPRLMIVIAAIASKDPLDIVAFSDSGPHASAGVPLRLAELAETNGKAASGWRQAMLALLRAQDPPYLPAKDGTMSHNGKKVLYLQFPVPSPLGLLGPSSP